MKKEFLIRCQGGGAALILVVPVPDEGIAGMIEDVSSVDFDCREQIKEVRDAVGGESWGDESLNRIRDGIEGRRVVGLGAGDLFHVA